jgi:hypothetical protein
VAFGCLILSTYFHLCAVGYLDGYYADHLTFTDHHLVDRFFALSLYPCTLLSYLFIFLHDPHNSPGLIHATFLLIGTASRGSLFIIPNGVDSSYTSAYSYGYLYIVDAIFWAIFSILVATQRFAKIRNNLSEAQAVKYTLEAVPSVMFSTLTTLLFLVGETASCLNEKVYDDVDPFSKCTDPETCPTNYNVIDCKDVLDSNLALSFFIVSLAGVQLLIFPFLETHYNMGHMLRFDFSFVQQTQILFMGLTAMLAIFIFASSQDQGYESESQLITSETGRGALLDVFKTTQLLFLFTTYVYYGDVKTKVRGAGPSNPGWIKTWIKATTQYFRGCMRTRSTISFAPVHRSVFVILALFCIIPAATSVVLFIVGSTQDGKRNLLLAWYAMILSFAFASFYAFSTPSGKQTAEDAFFITAALLNGGLIIAGLVLANDFHLSIILAIVSYLIAFGGGFVLIRISREHIALHSDAQIEQHLRRSANVVAGMLGPAIFLFAETASCYLTNKDGDNFEFECSRLYQCNWTVSFQLVVASVLYLATGISNQHLTTEDMLGFRNVDSAFVIRGVLQAITWFVALVLFGARPRNGSDPIEYVVHGWTEAGATVTMTQVVRGLKGIVVSIWITLATWEVFHLKHKVVVDRIMSGELEDDEEPIGWVAKRWAAVWERTNKWMEDMKVSDEKRASSSTFYLLSSVLFTWLLLAAVPFSLGALLLYGKDSNEMFLWMNWWSCVKIPVLVMVTMHGFLDLEAAEKNEDQAGSLQCWKYRDVHPYIFCIFVVFEIPLSYIMYGEFPSGAVSILILAVLIARLMAGRRRRAIERVSREKRRAHVFNVVYPTMASIAMPLTFMTSEMGACWLKSYLETLEEESMRDENAVCGGIVSGVGPLTMLISFMSFPLVCYVDAKSTFSLENMSTLNLSASGLAQVALVLLCSVYALFAYALRTERIVDVNGPEGYIFLAYTIILTGTVVIGRIEENQTDSSSNLFGENDLVISRPGQGSVSSRGSVSDRKSVGARKSVWDGGTRGAGTTRSIASLSARGIVNERQQREAEGQKIEMGGGDAAFNPGFM